MIKNIVVVFKPIKKEQNMKTFKNLLCFSLIAMGWLQADMLDNFNKAITATPLKSLMKSRIK